MKNNNESLDNNASEPIKSVKVETKDEQQKRNVEALEENYRGKSISLNQVKEYSEDLATWLKSIARYGNVDKTMIMILSNKDNFGECEEYVKIKFFTAEHCYSIIARKPSNEDKEGYLGCISKTRKSRVGEWWTRGNDLADGKFNKRTWDNIVCDIVSYEMKNLQIDTQYPNN